MKFLSYNIQYGVGPDGRFEPERIARSLEDADMEAAGSDHLPVGFELA